MTRKDYVSIAKAFQTSRIEGHGLNSASAKYVREQWELSVEHVAKVFAADNPRFDRERFLKACRV